MPHVWIPLETVGANSTDCIVEPFSFCQTWYEHDQCFAHGLTQFADRTSGQMISHNLFVCDNRYSQSLMLVSTYMFFVGSYWGSKEVTIAVGLHGLDE